MVIEELHLGITRNCSLYCEHCLRGEKECVNISLETLDNLFKDITGVKTLLITGGEPLIAIQQLERLAQIIREKDIKVGFIKMITNGTVMSARVLRVLKDLKELAELDIKVSANIFHILELERLGLMERRNKNFVILNTYFDAVWYGEEATEARANEKQLLTFKGRTKTLTKERLEEINAMVAHKYVTSLDYGFPISEGRRLSLCDDNLLGQLTIDVYGDIVGYGLEFKEEDIEAKRHGFNINKLGLMSALDGYIKLQDQEYEKKEAEFIKKLAL